MELRMQNLTAEARKVLWKLFGAPLASDEQAAIWNYCGHLPGSSLSKLAHATGQCVEVRVHVHGDVATIGGVRYVFGVGATWRLQVEAPAKEEEPKT